MIKKKNIKKDPRHSIQASYTLDPYDKRIFPSWGMRYFSHGEICHAIKIEHVLQQVIESMQFKMMSVHSFNETVGRLCNIIAKRFHLDRN